MAAGIKDEEKKETTTTPKKSGVNKFFDLLKNSPMKEAAFWLVFIVALTSQMAENATLGLWDLSSAALEKISKGLKKAKPYILWTLGIFLVPAIIFAVIAFSAHSTTWFLVLVAWTAIFVTIFYFGGKERKEEGREESLVAKVVESYNRFMRKISSLFFLIFAAVFLIHYTPTAWVPSDLKVAGLIIYVLLAFLTVSLDIKWHRGLIIMIIICLIIWGGLVTVGEEAITGWANELKANNDLTTIVTTDEIELFTMSGNPHFVGTKKLTIPKGTRLDAVFSNTVTTIGYHTATLVYTEGKISGQSSYALLRKGKNYERK